MYWLPRAGTTTLNHALPTTCRNHYPERLGCAYILGAPRVFIALWNVVRVALDARTRSKVCFLRSQEALAEALGVDALPQWMGGTPGSRLDAHLQAFLDGAHKHMSD